MKQTYLALGGAIALCLSAAASAADLGAPPYMKAPPPVVAPVYDWSGFYVGVNGGGGSAHTCWNFITDENHVPVFPVGVEGCHNATGGTAGGQVGYRWQAANWVFGIEGQGNWAAASLFLPTDNRTRIDAFGLVTGQVGYAWNNVLLYAKGGGAAVGDKFNTFDVTSGGLPLSSGSDSRWGGTAGGGIEVGFAPNWSIGVEYDHIFLGNRNVGFTAHAGIFDGVDNVTQNVDVGLVRLNYHWGGPWLRSN